MTEASEQMWRVLVADAEYASIQPDMARKFADLDIVIAGEGQDLNSLAGTGIQGLVVQDATIDSAFLDSLPDLAVVLKMGRSYHNIDSLAVRGRGLTFASSPRKGPNCVAELALTLMLSLSKDLLNSHRAVEMGSYRLRGLRPIRTEQWKMAFHWMRNQVVHELRDKRLGIVGMGEIGCELAARAAVMGMQTTYYKRSRLSSELERRFSAEYRDLGVLLAESDYVVLAVPHTPETERLIGAEQLAMMKPEAYLVNICRGGVVDEEALIDALQKGQIAGAGLDVFTFEPLPFDSPLCHMHNVILTPHIGGGSGTNRTIELTDALTELRAILAGRPPRFDLT